MEPINLLYSFLIFLLLLTQVKISYGFNPHKPSWQSSPDTKESEYIEDKPEIMCNEIYVPEKEIGTVYAQDIPSCDTKIQKVTQIQIEKTMLVSHEATGSLKTEQKDSGNKNKKSLLEKRKELRRTDFIFNNGIPKAENKLGKYLEEETNEIEAHTTSEILTLNIKRFEAYLWAKDVDNHATSTLMRDENQVEIMQRDNEIPSKEEKERILKELEKYMEQQLYVTINEIQKVFGITETTARRYINELNAVSSLNGKEKRYALPSIVKSHINKMGFFICDGWRFHIKRTLDGAVMYFIDRNGIGSYFIGLGLVCGRDVNGVVNSLVSEGKIRVKKIDGYTVLFSGNKDIGALQMKDHPIKANENLSYKEIAQEFKSLLECLKIELEPIKIKNNKKRPNPISIYLMYMFALINRWTDRKLEKELNDSTLLEACLLDKPLNHKRISEYFKAMSIDEINMIRVAVIHYLIKEGVIGQDLCYDGFQLDSYGNYNKRTKKGKRLDDETADMGNKGYGRTADTINDQGSELTLDVDLRPSSEHESKHMVKFVLETKDELQINIRYLYADKAFWDVDIIKSLSEAKITPKIMEKKGVVVAEGQLTLNAFLKGVKIKEVSVGRGGKKKRKIIVDEYKRDLVFTVDDAETVTARVKRNKHVQKYRVAVERTISRLRELFSADHVRVVGKENVTKHVKMAVLTQLVLAAIAVRKNMKHLIRGTSHITRWEE
jgi:hypothetical protein